MLLDELRLIFRVVKILDVAAGHRTWPRHGFHLCRSLKIHSEIRNIQRREGLLYAASTVAPAPSLQVQPYPLLSDQGLHANYVLNCFPRFLRVYVEVQLEKFVIRYVPYITNIRQGLVHRA